MHDLKAGTATRIFAFVGQGEIPSGYGVQIPLWGKAQFSINLTRLKLADYDAAFGEFLRSPEPAAQINAARWMTEPAQAYMPMLPANFRTETNCVQPCVLGFGPPIFKPHRKFPDIDPPRQRQLIGK